MNHELTAKWHELYKVQVGLKDVVVLRPDLRVADGYIQYSTDSGSTWQNLIALAELKGADGSKGDPGIAGQDGHSPVVTATKSGKTTTISVDGAAIATVEDGADGAPGKDGADGSNGKDGKDGAPGAKGADGITPTIGANGHWYLGPTDTGKPSRGEKGEKGDPGKDGAGMDVTGATVGQIAKIAAVDASGVPTAWSPADMPSGGSSDLYVDFWPTGTEEYNGNYNGYQIELATDQTFDAIFDSIKAGNKVVARLYESESKDGSPTSSVDTSVSGIKEFGAIHFQFVTANADTGAIAGFPFIGEAIMMIKMEEAAASYLIENRNVLPTPNADGTDNGKVPIINGTKWELKTLPTYANGNEVSY